jgi:hypothetical protein
MNFLIFGKFWGGQLACVASSLADYVKGKYIRGILYNTKGGVYK